ncbi:MAG: hypothetical protein H0Z34_12185 [Brevibacillus sp.]|nr:hypothetical protein [Brevibacillus sp.]
MIRSPLGMAIAAFAVVLSVSPQARKTVRRAAVSGTALLLDLTDQVRNVLTGSGEQGQAQATDQPRKWRIGRHPRLRLQLAPKMFRSV